MIYLVIYKTYVAHFLRLAAVLLLSSVTHFEMPVLHHIDDYIAKKVQQSHDEYPINNALNYP